MRNTGAELHADGRTRDVAIKAVAVRLRTTQLPAAGRHYHLRLLRPAVAALPPTQTARRRRRPFRSERTGSTRVQAPQVPGVTRSWQLLRQVCRVENSRSKHRRPALHFHSVTLKCEVIESDTYCLIALVGIPIVFCSSNFDRATHLFCDNSRSISD